MVIKRDANCCENCTHRLSHRSDFGRTDYCELIYKDHIDTDGSNAISYNHLDKISKAYILPTQVCDYWSSAVSQKLNF